MFSLVIKQMLYPSTISIASNLVTSINYLNTISEDDLELQTLIKSQDIVCDIEIIKSFLEEKSHLRDSSNTINQCINNLSQTLEELEGNITSITRKLQIHRQLWFNKFRSYNIIEEKKKIPMLISKLRHRFDLLIKITKVIKI